MSFPPSLLFIWAFFPSLFFFFSSVGFLHSAHSASQWQRPGSQNYNKMQQLWLDSERNKEGRKERKGRNFGIWFEDRADFDAANEPCDSKEEPKQMPRWWEKQNRKWKRAGPLTSRNLSPSPSPPSPFLSVSLSHLLKPSNYSNEQLRARQREAVRDWEDRWE